MLHFSGTFRDEFFAVSATLIRRDSDYMFAEFTGPDFASAVQAAGGGPAISRDEFKIFRYAIHGDQGLDGFRITEPGEFVAVLVTDPNHPGSDISRAPKSPTFQVTWPEGMVAHFAGEFGAHLGIFDLWRAEADRGSFYSDRITSAVSESSPSVVSVVKTTRPRSSCTSRYINSSSFEDNRDYLRQ